MQVAGQVGSETILHRVGIQICAVSIDMIEANVYITEHVLVLGVHDGRYN